MQSSLWSQGGRAGLWRRTAVRSARRVFLARRSNYPFGARMICGSTSFARLAVHRLEDICGV
jgi:hypothetical protein